MTVGKKIIFFKSSASVTLRISGSYRSTKLLISVLFCISFVLVGVI